MSTWDREGQRVKTNYLDEFKVTGTVTNSRVKYGGRVQHTIQLDKPVSAYGTTRLFILADEEDVFA